MTEDSPRPRKILDWEEILSGISELAENGEGAQRAAAYRMLMTARGNNNPVLSDSMPEKDVINRLARLMKACGKTICQVAYGAAYPLSKTTLKDIPSYKIDHIDFSNVKLPETLKQLYKQYPEIKRHGFPPGYPQGRGVEMKKTWCMNQAKLMIRDRKQKEEEMGRLAQEAKDDPNAPKTAVFPRIGAPNEERVIG